MKGNWIVEKDHFLLKTRLFDKNRKNYVGRKKPQAMKEKEEAKKLKRGIVPLTRRPLKQQKSEMSYVPIECKLYTCVDCGLEYSVWKEHKIVCKHNNGQDYFCKKCKVYDDIFNHFCPVACGACGVETIETTRCKICAKVVCNKCDQNSFITNRFTQQCTHKAKPTILPDNCDDACIICGLVHSSPYYFHIDNSSLSNTDKLHDFKRMALYGEESKIIVY
jgi:hypothetical protein